LAKGPAKEKERQAASGLGFLQHVSRPAHGMNQFRLKISIDFFTKIFDIDIDNVGKRIKVDSPHMLGN